MSKMLDSWKKLFTRKSKRRKLNRAERMQILVSLIALLIVILMVLGIFLPAFLMASESDDVTARYRTAAVETGVIQREVNATPSIVWLKEENLYFDYEGAYLEEVMVRDGDWVSEGEPLITFERQVPAADLARLELEQERLLSRQKAEQAALTASLTDLKSSTEQNNSVRREIERLEIRLRSLQSEHETQADSLVRQIAELSAMYETDTLTSPMEGIIVNVASLRAGELVQADQRLITMRDPREAYFVIEGSGDGFHYGQELELQFGFANAPQFINAKVILAPELSELRTIQQATVLEVSPDDLREAALNNEKDPDTYSIGDLNNIRLTAYSTNLSNVLTVPRSAVNHGAGKHYVYILEDNVLRRRYFQKGADDLANVQVISGLEAGQTLVIR